MGVPGHQNTNKTSHSKKKKKNLEVIMSESEGGSIRRSSLELRRR